jgi:hypothetical protein
MRNDGTRAWEKTDQAKAITWLNKLLQQILQVRVQNAWANRISPGACLAGEWKSR